MHCILSIETSIPDASIALMHDSEMLTQEKFQSHRQQNKLLFPALKSLITDLPSDAPLDLVIVGTGPGSYSGTRISIAAAQGLAIAHSCPVVGLSSYLGTQTVSNNPISHAIGDAKRGSFFLSKVEFTHAKFHASKPEILSLEALVDKLESIDTDTHPLFSFDEKLPIPDSFHYVHEIPLASLLTKNWLKLSHEAQQNLLKLPPQPAYLRAPFITKAKPGHPLLRQK